jgi:hypothetical protein
MESTEILEDLRARFARVERAIMGDPSVGHKGLVTRVEALETLALSAPELHQTIDDRRIEGDRRLHDRIDRQEELARDEVAAIGKKVDRIIYVFAGAFLGGAGTGGGVMYAILGG